MHLHLSATNSPDYYVRRDLPCPPDLKNARYGETYRLAHVNHFLATRSVVRAGGPSLDGEHAELFCQVESVAALDSLLQEDPYVVGGVWTGWTIRTLAHFVEPTGLVDVCLDGSRRVMVVEGKVADEGHALAGPRRLRGQEALAVGGIFEDQTLIAWVRAAEDSEALALMSRAEILIESPVCRPLAWVL